MSAALDYAKFVVTVKTKGAEIGSFAGATADVFLDTGTGLDPIRLRVRLGTAGTTRVY